ncbi:MAG: alpha/beta fold hydrolase [Acidimicrobiales bacterium]
MPTRLVLLHGFTQTASSWGPLARLLDGRFDLVMPDAPGHGSRSHVRADLWQTADLLAGLTAGPTPGATSGRATWVGYSMGGRMALHVALAHPEAVDRLVLISTNPGIQDAEARQKRRASDEALARRIEAEGLSAFLDWWLAQPLFATLAPSAAGLGERLANTEEGLASSLRLAGLGSQEPLWHRLGELGERGLPVLLVAGELDSAYRSHAEHMAAVIGPSARLEVVQGAGHACHLERPAQLAAAIASFTATAPPGTAGHL